MWHWKEASLLDLFEAAKLVISELSYLHCSTFLTNWTVGNIGNVGSAAESVESSQEGQILTFVTL